MQHVELGAGEFNRVALLQPSVGRHVLAALHTKARACFRQPIKQELVPDIGSLDRNAAQQGLERGSASGVVEMPVGQRDPINRHPERADLFGDVLAIATGVDHGAMHCRLVPQQRAVLLDRRNRDDGNLHGQASG